MRVLILFDQIAILCVLFCGMLFMPDHWYSEGLWLTILIAQGLPLILLLLFTAVFRLQISALKPRDREATPSIGRADWLLIFNLLLSYASLIFALGYIAQHFEKLFLQVALLCPILGVLGDRLAARHAQAGSLAARWGYLAVVGFLSCMAFLGIVRWQPMLLAAALAASATSVEISKRLEQEGLFSAWAPKLASFTMCLGPVSFACLAMSAQLPRSWLFALLPLSLSAAHLHRLEALRGGQAPFSGLLRESTGIYWLFVLTLVLVRIIFGWR